MWDTIGVISFLCLFLFIILGIISLIKRTGKTKKMMLGAFIFFIVFMVSAVNAPPAEDVSNGEVQENAIETSTKVDTKNKETVEQVKSELINEENEKQTVPGTLGYGVEEFKNRFNAAAKELDSSFTISNITVENGTVQDTFQYMLTENIALIGTINKADGTIRDVMMIGRGDGSFGSGADIFITMGILIITTNPDLLVEERGDILEDLGLMDENVNILDIDKSTIRNGVKYHLSSSELLGITFIVSDANDN